MVAGAAADECRAEFLGLIVPNMHSDAVEVKGDGSCIHSTMKACTDMGVAWTLDDRRAGAVRGQAAAPVPVRLQRGLARPAPMERVVAQCQTVQHRDLRREPVPAARSAAAAAAWCHVVPNWAGSSIRLARLWEA